MCRILKVAHLNQELTLGVCIWFTCDKLSGTKKNVAISGKSKTQVYYLGQHYPCLKLLHDTMALIFQTNIHQIRGLFRCTADYFSIWTCVQGRTESHGRSHFVNARLKSAWSCVASVVREKKRRNLTAAQLLFGKRQTEVRGFMVR